jgi:hypothetical protein
MKTQPGQTPENDDRREAVMPVVEEHRVTVSDRRESPRMRTLKGAQIVWPTAPPVKCTVRNLSTTGAALEVQSPVPGTFELVFDGDQSRRSCRVVWRRETRIGVQFQ